MIKKVVIVSPEFTDTKTLHVPWRQIFEIAKFFQKNKIQTIIFTSGYKNTEINGIEIKNLDQKILQNLNLQSIKKIIDISPDLIYWMGNTYSGYFLSKNKIDIPIILHISSVHMTKKEFKNMSMKEIWSKHRIQFLTSFFPFNRIVKKLNNQRITAIISANKTIANRLISLGVDKKKIKTSELFFEPVFKNDITINEEEMITYAGPIESIRGSEIALEAIKILKEKGRNIKLLFLLRSYESEREKPILEEKCKKLKIQNNVKIVAGILQPNELRDYFLKSRIIIIPTKFVWNEPPVTILEAMGLGKVVITTNVCGIPEMVNNYAIILAPKAQDFANEIEKIFDNKDKLREIGNKSMKYVQGLKNWESLGQWTLETMEKVIGNEKHHS